MLNVSKSDLKARMLEYFRRVEETGEEIIVTSHGKPVARVVPYRPQRSVEDVFADLRGKVRYHADLSEPTSDEWGDL